MFLPIFTKRLLEAKIIHLEAQMNIIQEHFRDALKTWVIVVCYVFFVSAAAYVHICMWTLPPSGQKSDIQAAPTWNLLQHDY